MNDHKISFFVMLKSRRDKRTEFSIALENATHCFLERDAPFLSGKVTFYFSDQSYLTFDIFDFLSSIMCRVERMNRNVVIENCKKEKRVHIPFSLMPHEGYNPIINMRIESDGQTIQYHYD